MAIAATASRNSRAPPSGLAPVICQPMVKTASSTTSVIGAPAIHADQCAPSWRPGRQPVPASREAAATPIT